jgi:polyadenylate-binding protein
MRYDELSSLSPVVRREVLTGELSRRVKDVPGVSLASNEVDGIVDALLGLSLHQLVDGIQDSAKLAEQVRNAKEVLSATTAEGQSATHSPSPATSHDSRLLDPNAFNATASAPEHPSTPLSLSASLSTPPRTSSPSGSVAPGASEKDRLMVAVSKLEAKHAAEITDLLMSLSKRERALCLFNAEVLKAKVTEAIEVLEVVTVESDVPPPQTGYQGKSSHSSTVPAPVTPHSKLNSTTSDDSPQTPDLSSRGPSTAASPTSPPTPGQGTIHTLSSLARLPASEIVKLANSSSATGLPLAKADPRIVEETNQFVDGLQGKPVQQQKQLLGEKLFDFFLGTVCCLPLIIYQVPCG